MKKYFFLLKFVTRNDRYSMEAISLHSFNKEKKIAIYIYQDYGSRSGRGLSFCASSLWVLTCCKANVATRMIHSHPLRVKVGWNILPKVPILY